MSKIVDPDDSDADASSMITVKTKRLPIYLDDAIWSLEQGTASSEGSMSTMDVEVMVKKALLAIQGQTVSTPAGSGRESAFNRHLKTLLGESRKEIEKTLQRAKGWKYPS